MTELEKDIERSLVSKVRQSGGYCLKWVCPGWSGVPDRIILLPGGRIIFAELKRPKEGKLSERQKWWARKLTDLGFCYWQIWNRYGLGLFEIVELRGDTICRK